MSSQNLCLVAEVSHEHPIGFWGAKITRKLVWLVHRPRSPLLGGSVVFNRCRGGSLTCWASCRVCVIEEPVSGLIRLVNVHVLVSKASLVVGGWLLFSLSPLPLLHEFSGTGPNLPFHSLFDRPIGPCI